MASSSVGAAPDTGAASTADLVETLTRRNVFDTPEGLARRYQVVQTLEDLLGRWSDGLTPVTTSPQVGAAVTTATADKNQETPQARPVIICFGSYRLGVHNPTADIDALALCPPHCTRADFFGSWVTLLEEDDNVEDLHPVPGAYTPVIKFCYGGIQVDMVFARRFHGMKLLHYHNSQKYPTTTTATPSRKRPRPGSDVSSSPYDPTKEGWQKSVCVFYKQGRCTRGSDCRFWHEDNREDEPSLPSSEHDDEDESSPTDETDQRSRTDLALDDTDLIGLDEAGVRSINGCRVAQFLLEHVPDIEKFRLVLRTVKEWASCHGLYSNVLGYLGGVNWAILVAKICVMHPEDASVPELLHSFMKTYATYDWSMPITLAKLSSKPPTNVPVMPVWNPRTNPRDRSHIMPIITPCYPMMNSSYNVGHPQLRRLQQEFARAEQMIGNVIQRKGRWDELFQDGRSFFRHHIHFVQATITAADDDSFRVWQGYCESRIRNLIAALECDKAGTQAHPFAKFFRQNDTCDFCAESENTGSVRRSLFYVALRFSPDAESVDLKPLLEDFLNMLNSWDGREDGMDLDVTVLPQDELPHFVFGDDEDYRNDAGFDDKHDNEDDDDREKMGSTTTSIGMCNG